MPKPDRVAIARMAAMTLLVVWVGLLCLPAAAAEEPEKPAAKPTKKARKGKAALVPS